MKTSKLFFSLLIVSNICAGTGSTMSQKAQQLQTVAPCAGCDPIAFDHAYMQTFFIFLGESICMIIYLVMLCIQKYRKTVIELVPGKKLFKFVPHAFWFFVPGIFDLISSQLNMISLFYSLPSVRLVLARSNTLFIALFSFIIWPDYRAKFDLPQGLGLIILFGGAAITAAATIIFQGDGETAKNPVIGVITVVIGALFASFYYICQELVLRRVQAEALLGVGCEGTWGVLVFAILLPIFNVIQSPFDPTRKLETTADWFYQTSHSLALSITLPFQLLFTVVNNACGMEIIKRATAVTRATVGAQVTILVWIVSFAIGWETWETKSTLTRFAGFILVTSGALIYNNVLKLIPFLKPANIKLHGKWMGRGGKEVVTDIDPESSNLKTSVVFVADADQE